MQGGAVSVCAAENVACKPIFQPNMGGKKHNLSSIKQEPHICTKYLDVLAIIFS